MRLQECKSSSTTLSLVSLLADLFFFLLDCDYMNSISAVGSNVKSLKKGDRVALEPGQMCRHCEICKDGCYELCKDMVSFCYYFLPSTTSGMYWLELHYRCVWIGLCCHPSLWWYFSWILQAILGSMLQAHRCKLASCWSDLIIPVLGVIWHSHHPLLCYYRTFHSKKVLSLSRSLWPFKQLQK